MSSQHLHDATVTLGSSDTRPYHAQCSCGTAGDFADKSAAVAYIEKHFQKLGGVAETSLKVDAPDDAKVAAKAVAAKPPVKPHIGGIGTMPPSHAAAITSVSPPPPPDAKK